MLYQEYKPAGILEQYVKCYYSLEYASGTVLEDQAFATGCIEVMFTLDGSLWQTKLNDSFTTTSPIELWGQILKPLTFRVAGNCKLFGIRFHPAAAAFFLRQDIDQFSDHVFDLTSVIGNGIVDLHHQLQDAGTDEQRANLMDAYLLRRKDDKSKIISKINLVQQVMSELSGKDFFDNIENVAACYGITSRYLQKLFLQQSGLTPQVIFKD